MVGCLSVLVAGVIGVTVHWFAGFVILVVGLTIAAQKAAKAKEARIAELTTRFGADVAGRIERHEVWEGATREMILLSLGDPVDIDEKVMKGKTKHTLKYDQTGKNKFGLRVTLEDDVCVGWDDKR